MKTAIVGNSGKLLNQEYGMWIDSHDIIIRFNEAPTFNFERYVGSRTDIRFIVYADTREYLECDYTNYCLLYSYSQKMRDLGLSIFENSIALPGDFINKCDAMVGKPYFRWKLLKILGFDQVYEYKPISSIGFKGIMWALKYYDKINLFGFDFAEGSKFHYWQDMAADHKPNKWHNYEKEKEIIKGFENDGKIKSY